MSDAPSRPAADRIEALLAQGEELLRNGKPREAVLVFERILYRSPVCQAARSGLERAQAQGAEEALRRETRFQAIDDALLRGDRERARSLVESLLEEGGDRDRLLPLRDRLDDRRGLVTLARPLSTASRWPLRGEVAGRSSRARRAFLLGWAILILAPAVGVALGWEEFVMGLTATPSPTHQSLQVSAGLPRVTPGERALREARERAEAGDIDGAVALLERIVPADAAYPYARHVRGRLLAQARGGPQ